MPGCSTRPIQMGRKLARIVKHMRAPKLYRKHKRICAYGQTDLPRKASALLGPSSVGVVEGLDVLVDWPDDKGVVPQELPCALTPSAPAVAPVLTEEEEGGRSLHESLRPCILVCKSHTARSHSSPANLCSRRCATVSALGS